MEEKYNDLIDRYLRNEMSREEKLDFEQQVLNNEQLKSELELTCRIKHRLADRQQKLRKTNEWKRRSMKGYIYMGAVTSIAASLAIAFLVWPASHHSLEGPSVEAIAMAPSSAPTEEQAIVHVEEATKKARANVKKGKDKEVIESVNELESRQFIPQVGQISEIKLMSATVDTQERDTLLSNAYELYWMKIQSLLRTGKKAEAKTLLQEFSSIEGRYKEQADSLLNTLE